MAFSGDRLQYFPELGAGGVDPDAGGPGDADDDSAFAFRLQQRQAADAHLRFVSRIDSLSTAFHDTSGPLQPVLFRFLYFCPFSAYRQEMVRGGIGHYADPLEQHPWIFLFWAAFCADRAGFRMAQAPRPASL